MIVNSKGNRKPTIINNLITFDKEMTVFYKGKQLKVKTPEHNYSWSGIKYELQWRSGQSSLSNY